MSQLLSNFLDTSTLIPILLILGPIVWWFLNNQKPNIVEAEVKSTTTNTSSTATSGVTPKGLFGSSAGNKKLPPPKDDIFTPEELSKYDGSNKDLPVYVAIKGKIFDVTESRDTYSPGGSYYVFSGCDGSRALALSSIKKSDISHDYSDLPPEKVKVLDDWYTFFERKYPIIGIVKRD